VSNPRFSHRRGTNTQDLLAGVMPKRALSCMVPPAHTALRRALAPCFKPAATRPLEPWMRKLVGRFLDEVDDEFDVVGDLALRLSARVTFRLIGLPEEDADEMGELVGTTFERASGVRGPTEVAFEAQRRLHEYLTEKIDERGHARGGSDLLDRLLSFEHEGEKLPREELIANLYLLVIGGTETLPKVFAGAVHQLWRHPDQRASVAATPALAGDAFWEALRYDMPTLMLGSVAEEDAEICGTTQVRKGQKLMHLWVSANRDEREFPDPDRFDIHRRATRILTFNHGRHYCLGAHIAQLEGRVLLEELLARAPGYEVREDRAERIRSELFRGFSSLPIRV
jgi:cytochrome P450